MAWIESHEEIWDHHKIHRLCTAIKQPDYAVVGRLISLWHFVLRNAWKDANLEPWGDDGVERASRWDGEKGAWIAALRECGFLEGFVVHGWQERAGRLVQDRRRNEKRKIRRSTGGKTAVKRTRTSGKSVATIPDPTIPNQTIPNPTKDVAAKGAAVSPQALFVEKFKETYEAITGHPFNAEAKHYVIAAKLIGKHGLEAVVAKTKMLGFLCENRSTWFTEKGFSDFTIEKLQGQWNSILEDVKPSPEDAFRNELRKVEGQNERISTPVN